MTDLLTLPAIPDSPATWETAARVFEDHVHAQGWNEPCQIALIVQDGPGAIIRNMPLPASLIADTDGELPKLFALVLQPDNDMLIDLIDAWRQAGLLEGHPVGLLTTTEMWAPRPEGQLTAEYMLGVAESVLAGNRIAARPDAALTRFCVVVSARGGGVLKRYRGAPEATFSFKPDSRSFLAFPGGLRSTVVFWSILRDAIAVWGLLGGPQETS